MAERTSNGAKTYICFIDIKKAYDRVWRDGLWWTIAENGVKGKMWRILRAMYRTSKSKVFCGGQDSEIFDVELGVRQGDVLSPLVFSIFFNGLIRALKAKGYGVEVRWKRICGLWYADDIALMAGSQQELRDMLKCVDEYCEKWRCAANAKKSGVMIVGGADDGHEDGMPYYLNGEVVPIVSTYKYLGIVFNNTWSWTDQSEYVLSRATKAVDNVEFRFWKNRSVDIESKVIAWKSVFRPAIEYGSEVWWPLKADLERLEILQRKVCKWILGCCRTTTSEVVLGDLGLYPLESRFTRARLAWAGTLQCIGEDRIVGMCNNLNITKYKNKKTWAIMVDDSLKRLGLQEEFESLHMINVAEENKKQIASWKLLVKSKLMEYDNDEWAKGLSVKKKAFMYTKIKAYPRFEESLGLSEFQRGGLLRFKLRSGTCMLNIEKGRRSRKEEDRMCSVCDMGTEESVEHFILECPAYVDERKSFESNLRAVSETSSCDVVKMWMSDSTYDRVSVVLGDCVVYDVNGPTCKPEKIAGDIRSVSHNYLMAMWQKRKVILYRDLAIPFASGAQTSQSGSAS